MHTHTSCFTDGKHSEQFLKRAVKSARSLSAGLPTADNQHTILVAGRDIYVYAVDGATELKVSTLCFASLCPCSVLPLFPGISSSFYPSPHASLMNNIFIRAWTDFLFVMKANI